MNDSRILFVKDIVLRESKWRVGKGEAIVSNSIAWCKVRDMALELYMMLLAPLRVS